MPWKPYTRKSTEEGLEQEFNSLDAQREACAAYVASQKAEGWVLLPTVYEDAGSSGGTLERPGLQRLLDDDDDAGLVEQIVVYKVDRLTRSLSDFAKLVERLEAAGAVFVSVTQSFNTATSMGRLTLHMLLSFAQFEREVTAERIRDKIAASKRKGLWMGGRVPLGYEKDERTLRINEAEAETVRTLYALYRKHGTLRQVKAEAGPSETAHQATLRRGWKPDRRVAVPSRTPPLPSHALRMVSASSALSSFFCYRGLAPIGQPSVDTFITKRPGEPVLSSFVFLDTTGSIITCNLLVMARHLLALDS